jgi:NAD-dependent deacetylase
MRRFYKLLCNCIKKIMRVYEMIQFDHAIPTELIEKIRKAQHLVVVTGAGVSAESGIPTFRDALTGLWRNYVAEELASANGFRKSPALVWGWYEWRRNMVLQAKPNAAHEAIAQLATKVPKLTLVTQNVDDLHERAGSVDVLHLHGSLHAPRCFACARPHNFVKDSIPELTEEKRIEPPRCSHCGGKIRPGVVWFGENLPEKIFQQAEAAAGHCDVMLVVGTSGLVYPAANIPLIAIRKQAATVQINPTSTDFDSFVTYNLVGKAGEILPAILEKL